MSLFHTTKLFPLWDVLVTISCLHASLAWREATANQCEVPYPVTDVKVSLDDYSSFTLTWRSPGNIPYSCIDAFKICFGPVGNASKYCSTSKTNSYTNDAVSQTEVCTNYTASVVVVGEAGYSNSTSINFRTGAAQVMQLTANNTTKSETTLRWESPDTLACAKYFKIYHCAYDGAAEQDCVYQTRTTTLSKTSFKLAGLQSCKDNHIWMATVDKYGGESNVSIVVHTGDGHPPKVHDVTTTSNRGSTFDVSWLVPADFNPKCHAGYRVCFASQHDGSGLCSFTTTNKYIARRTTACTNYTVNVQTVDGELRDDSHLSAEALHYVFTQPTVPPVMVDFDSQVAGLSWPTPDNASASCLLDYEVVECVQRPSTGDCEELHRETLPANTTAYNSSQLPSCATTLLKFSVVAKNKDSASISLNFVSTQGKLQPLTSLTVVSANTKQMTLAWTPSDFNECTDHYRVCWTLYDSRTCKDSTSEMGETFTNISLVACHAYSVRTSAVNKKNYSDSTTTDVEIGPENVANQQVELSATSALVTWSRDTGAHRCSTGYSVAWCPASQFSDACDGPPTGNVTLSDTTTHYDITHLETCAKYFIIFQTLGRNESLGSMKNITQIKTPIGKLGPITDLTIHQWENKTVSLDIVFPNNTTKCITRFTTCFYETDNEDTEKYCRLLRTEWVNRTQPCTSYTIDITAVAYDKQASNGSVTFVAGPGQVDDVVVKDDVESESADVTWFNPGERASRCVEYLKVTCTPAEANQPVVEERLPSNVTGIHLEKLTKCTSYTLQIQAVASAGVYGPLVVHQFTTTESGLDKVRELNLTYTSEGHFSVTWEPPERRSCVVSYRICWSAEGADASCETTFNNQWTSSQYDKLQSCSKYTVSVAALDRYARSSENTTATFNTSAAQVSNVVPNISPSGRTVTFTWTFPESNVRCVSYQVASLIRAEDNLVLNRKNVSKEDTGSGFGGLFFCHSYKVEVQPITLDAASPPVVTAHFHSSSNVRSLSGLNVTGIKSDALLVRYTIAETTSNCVQYFQICWGARGGNKSCTNEQGHSSSSVNITGLKPATNYTVEVTPVAPDGHIYLTSTATGRTLTSSASMVTEVTVAVHEGGRSVRVLWTIPQKDLEGAEELLITCTRLKDDVAVLEKYVSWTTTSLVIGNLEPCVSYSVTIQPVNSDFISTDAASLHFIAPGKDRHC